METEPTFLVAARSFPLRLLPIYDIIYFGKLQGLQEFLRAFLRICPACIYMHVYTNIRAASSFLWTSGGWILQNSPKALQKLIFAHPQTFYPQVVDAVERIWACTFASGFWAMHPTKNMQRMQSRQAGFSGAEHELFPKGAGHPHACGRKSPLFHMLSFAKKPGKSQEIAAFPQHPHPLYLRQHI